MQKSILWRYRRAFPALVLLLVLSLAACGRSSAAGESPTSSASLSTSTSTQNSETQNAVTALEPASGYGGLYVQVNGEQWPQNMMVMVTLEDEQGRSETLAASDTDQAGHLTTGFLFPIDQRWLDSESLWVVTTTADGRIESKAEFTIIPPGTEVAASSSSTSTTTSAAIDEEGNAVTETVAMADEAEHTLVLPLVTSAGVERSTARRSTHSSSSRTTTSRGNSSSAAQVDVEVSDCRNGQEWITVAIFSTDGFDATAVDPGSVVVSGGSSDLGYSGPAMNDFVAFKESDKQGRAERNRRAYQWTWQLDDVDGDGSSDMVMEFSLDYIGLECGATVVVSGRTRDGKQFEATSGGDMLVLERG